MLELSMTAQCVFLDAKICEFGCHHTLIASPATLQKYTDWIKHFTT